MDTSRLLTALDKAGRESHLVSGGDEILVECPQCGKEKLYVNATTGLWVCHYCGDFAGGLVALLAQVCELPPFEAYYEAKEIRGRAPRATPSSAARPRITAPSAAPSTALPEGFVVPTQDGNNVQRYLAARGINPALQIPYGIGYCSTGFYAGRIVVPVWTEGKLLTWVARATLETRYATDRKVLMPRDSGARYCLFNHAAVEPPLCLLVEGVFDALRLPDLAIATLGAHLTEYQRRSLKRLGYHTVVLLRDGDEAGRRAAVREALELHAARFTVYIAPLPVDVDPGSASQQQIENALAKAYQITDNSSHTVLQREVYQRAKLEGNG